MDYIATGGTKSTAGVMGNGTAVCNAKAMLTVAGGTKSTAGVMGDGTVVCDARAMLTRKLLTFLGRCLSEWWCRSQ